MIHGRFFLAFIHVLMDTQSQDGYKNGHIFPRYIHEIFLGVSSHMLVIRFTLNLYSWVSLLFHISLAWAMHGLVVF